MYLRFLHLRTCGKMLAQEHMENAENICGANGLEDGWVEHTTYLSHIPAGAYQAYRRCCKAYTGILRPNSPARTRATRNRPFPRTSKPK
jgi:hypothetical protein